MHDHLILWSCDGMLDRIHYALYVACRERAEREASPTAAIIGSQSPLILLAIADADRNDAAT